jgi:RHS repeat-associated protein
MGSSKIKSNVCFSVYKVEGYFYTPSVQSYYFIHTDHIGSIDKITDKDGNVVDSMSFDAWGNRRDRNNWQLREGNITHLIDRGFTMHQHLDVFNLINMGGRVYDPDVQQFLSPDPYVQMPDNTQNLNRYVYCLNSPTMYVDPTGEKLKWWQGLLIGLGADVLSGGAISGAIITTTVTNDLINSQFGYELQKQISPIAFKMGVNFGSDGINWGIDISVGMPKSTSTLGYRFHAGASYGEWNYQKGYYKGWETRVGAEWSALGGLVGLSGTQFAGGFPQTTNKLNIAGLSYENDYMFGIAQTWMGIPVADGGDRWRSAAVEIRFGNTSLNLNMFTGDPDTYIMGDRYNIGNHDFIDEHETYTGGTANEYRTGVLSFNFGFFRIGGNSEQVRRVFQNRFAHDFLMGGKSYWFEVLKLPPRFYWFFGSGNGSTLW